jgi:hypothetical protein
VSETNTSTGAGAKIGAALLIGVAIIAAVLILNQETSLDTTLPPDPFEDEEPRIVDCVADWDGYNQGVTADVYCEVGGPENSFDASNLDLSPYIWSTTANTGQVAVIDMTVSRQTSGLCEIWVDGELLETTDVVQVTDETDAGDALLFGCAIEVPIP